MEKEYGTNYLHNFWDYKDEILKKNFTRTKIKINELYRKKNLFKPYFYSNFDVNKYKIHKLYIIVTCV